MQSALASAADITVAADEVLEEVLLAPALEHPVGDLDPRRSRREVMMGVWWLWSLRRVTWRRRSLPSRRRMSWSASL